LEVSRLSFLESLEKSAKANGMKIIYKGKFEMTEEENEEISLNFIEI
jgi:hypothetical protein